MALLLTGRIIWATSKDYEALPETSEALIYVAMIHLMVRHLARQRGPKQAAQQPLPLSLARAA